MMNFILLFVMFLEWQYGEELILNVTVYFVRPGEGNIERN